jgi:hypothetical protein
MHTWPYWLLLPGCLALAGCIKSHPATEEQPNPQPELQTKSQTRPQPEAKAEARNSSSGFWSSPPSEALTYPLLGTVTLIEIKNNSDEMIRRIEDREQVREIVSFVDKERSDWSHPWYGVPVPKVVANFYDGDKFKGHFGVGAKFLETQREGDFVSKHATTEQCRAFLSLLSVDKKVLDD